MAGASDANVTIPSGDDASSEQSTDDAVLTPEQRDAATFAKHGFNPDGSAMTVEELAVRNAASTTTDKATAKGKETADADGAEGDDTASKTAGDDADGTDDEDGSELTDERVDALVDSLLELKPEKLRNNPRIREQLRAELESELRAEFDAQQRAVTDGQQRERLIAEGRTAVDAVNALLGTARDGLTKAKAELAKADSPDETVNTAVVEDAIKALGTTNDEIMNHLAKFAVASTADVTRRYDNAYIDGFRSATGIAGPVTEEEMKSLQAIANNASRIEADPKQSDENLDAKERAKYGPDAGKRYFFVESFKFLTERAVAHGKTLAIAEAKAAKDARKTILDSDTVIAAAAKVAAKRGKLPPTPTEGERTETTVTPTFEAYQAAKRAGNIEEAERIREAMQNEALVSRPGMR